MDGTGLLMERIHLPEDLQLAFLELGQSLLAVINLTVSSCATKPNNTEVWRGARLRLEIWDSSRATLSLTSKLVSSCSPACPVSAASPSSSMGMVTGSSEFPGGSTEGLPNTLPTQSERSGPRGGLPSTPFGFLGTRLGLPVSARTNPVGGRGFHARE